MRSETQNHVDAIKKSLTLLGQRMDIETAPHRLEEFNALIENPDLWNDPAKAQKLMRERQGLIEAQSTYDLISSGLRDNVELIEMGEAEADAETLGLAGARHDAPVVIRQHHDGYANQRRIQHALARGVEVIAVGEGAEHVSNVAPLRRRLPRYGNVPRTARPPSASRDSRRTGAKCRHGHGLSASP